MIFNRAGCLVRNMLLEISIHLLIIHLYIAGSLNSIYLLQWNSIRIEIYRILKFWLHRNVFLDNSSHVSIQIFSSSLFLSLSCSLLFISLSLSVSFSIVLSQICNSYFFFWKRKLFCVSHHISLKILIIYNNLSCNVVIIPSLFFFPGLSLQCLARHALEFNEAKSN